MEEQSSTPVNNNASAPPPSYAADKSPATASPAAPTQSLVPSTWPGAFGAYKYSKAATKLNLKSFLILVVITFVLSAFGATIPKSGKSMYSFVSNILSLFISAAYYLILLSSVNGKKIEAVDAIKQGVKYVLKLLGLSILMVLAVMIGLLLLIVPGIILIPRLTFAPYFLIDKNQSIMDALHSSWNVSKGHSAKVWGIVGATLAMAMLAITIIGIPFAIYFVFMYSAATAVLYKFLAKTTPQATSPTSPPTSPVAAA